MRNKEIIYDGFDSVYHQHPAGEPVGKSDPCTDLSGRFAAAGTLRTTYSPKPAFIPQSIHALASTDERYQLYYVKIIFLLVIFSVLFGGASGLHAQPAEGGERSGTEEKTSET